MDYIIYTSLIVRLRPLFNFQAFHSCHIILEWRPVDEVSQLELNSLLAELERVAHQINVYLKFAVVTPRFINTSHNSDWTKTAILNQAVIILGKTTIKTWMISNFLLWSHDISLPLQFTDPRIPCFPKEMLLKYRCNASHADFSGLQFLLTFTAVRQIILSILSLYLWYVALGLTLSDWMAKLCLF